jgi:hypothetical protein
MRNCRTVKGLVKAVSEGVIASLKVWDIMPNGFDEGGAYLNLGGGAYSYVGTENWKQIRNHIKDQNGEYCKTLNKYQRYYNNN